MKKVIKQCLLDTPRTVRVSEKNLVLASDSSNQQTLVLKKKISSICENNILVESVQMILKLDIWNICLDQIHKIIHT